MTKLSDTLRLMGGDTLTKAAAALDACELALRFYATRSNYVSKQGSSINVLLDNGGCAIAALKLLEDDHASH